MKKKILVSVNIDLYNIGFYVCSVAFFLFGFWCFYSKLKGNETASWVFSIAFWLVGLVCLYAGIYLEMAKKWYLSFDNEYLYIRKWYKIKKIALKSIIEILVSEIDIQVNYLASKKFIDRANGGFQFIIDRNQYFKLKELLSNKTN